MDTKAEFAQKNLKCDIIQVDLLSLSSTLKYH
jgi:hypothetical protein